MLFMVLLIISGNCKTIIDCPHFYNATNYLSLDDFVTILPKYKCESDDILKICCPDYDITTSTTETTPSIPQTTPPILQTTPTIPEATPVIPETTLPLAIEKSNFEENLLPDPNKHECGKQLSENRIAGGNITEIDEFPWMVLLEYKTKSGKLETYCAGTLISDRYVLSAAHCFERRDTNLQVNLLINIKLCIKCFNFSLSVILGEYNTTTDPDCVPDFDALDCAPPKVTIRVEKVIQHPNWVVAEPQFYDDIALVRLDTKVTFSG